MGIESITAADRAASLRGAAHKVEVALLALETHEMRYAGRALEASQASDRRLLVDVASMLLWEYIVQREMCGVLDHRELRAMLRVPNEVWVRTGASPRPA